MGVAIACQWASAHWDRISGGFLRDAVLHILWYAMDKHQFES